MRPLISTALTALTLTVALVGCSSSEPDPEPETSSTQTVAADDVDRTVEAQEVAGDIVTAAREDSAGWLFVETSLTDDGDSTEAVAACDALLDAGYDKVNLAESDGTTYVLAGHPAYGETCTAV